MPRVTSCRTGAPSWIELSVPDVGAAVAFYRELFGWSTEDLGEATGGYHLCCADGALVAGIGPKLDLDRPSDWITTVAVDDLADLVRRIPSASGAVQVPPAELPGVGSVAVVLDAAGATVALWQPSGQAGVAPPGAVGAPVWHELQTRDGVTAEAFYGGLFGWSFADADGSPGRRTAVLAGEPVAALVVCSHDDPEVVDSHWTPYVAVDDVGAVAERASRLGGMVLVAPASGDAGETAVLADPGGARFAVVARR